MARQAIRAALVLAAGIAVLATLLLLQDGAAAALARLAADPWLFLAVAVLACTVGVPRQAIAYAAAFALGLWPGLALALLAQLAACALNIAWARALARDWVAAWLARRGGRMARLDAFLSANTFTATLMLRLLPVGNNLALNLLAGASGARALPYLAGSAIGFLPQTLVFALLGAGTRLDAMDQIVLGGALFVASALLGWVLWKRMPAGLAA